MCFFSFGRLHCSAQPDVIPVVCPARINRMIEHYCHTSFANIGIALLCINFYNTIYSYNSVEYMIGERNYGNGGSEIKQEKLCDWWCERKVHTWIHMCAPKSKISHQISSIDPSFIFKAAFRNSRIFHSVAGGHGDHLTFFSPSWQRWIVRGIHEGRRPDETPLKPKTYGIQLRRNDI